MKRKLSIVLALFLLGAVGPALYFGLRQKISKEPQVCVKGKCYLVEIARTPVERARGLMFRDNLDANRGMMFEFSRPGIYSFWMKNTLIPLDIVWLDNTGKIIFIYAGASPCRQENCPGYGPKSEASYVLEVNAGEMESLSAAVGDQVLINGN